jgi:ATP-dependent Clp protease ATP-binding subunit ClpC
VFGNFTEEARKILVDAKKEMYDLKHPYVGSEHLLLAILKEDNNISKRLKDYNLDYQLLKDEIIKIIGIGSNPSNWFLYTPLLKRIMENAIIDSKENNNGEVTVEHLFSSLLEEGEGVAIRVMIGMNIDVDELYGEFSYKLTNNSKRKKNKKLLLEELGIDLNKKALNNEIDPVVGREKEIKRVLEILSRRTKNNPLLIGEAGVGKTAIVEELSRMIVSGDVPLALRNKRIISLDMASTVAGTKYRGEFEERMHKILKEIEENDDIILFIDEIHTLVGAGGAEGAIDASNIFKPALSRNKLRCIGATTIDEYKKYIEEDGALERRFQKVTIEIPSKQTVKEILNKLKSIYEKYHFVSISDEIIDIIIELTEKYVYDRNQPDKSIDILDEVCAKVSLKESKEIKRYNDLNKQLQVIIKSKNESIVNNDFDTASTYKSEENKIMDEINNIELSLYKNSIKEVTKEDVAEVVSIKTKIPIYELLNDSPTIIKMIEENINSKIIGQDKAVLEIINIAKRIKLGFKDESKCYSMMFTGPSGVGKTELAKIFGNNLVGDANVIKLDMSEYTEAHTVSKIIGAPPGYVGYSDNKNILEEVRNKPYSVIILDEIEKAHNSIINLFFQILDDGKIKDASGKIIRFDNVVIIMTSNIGFDDINIGFNKKSDDVIFSKLKESFSLPFINRIDNIITFNKLSENDIEYLIKNKLDKLKEKYNVKKVKLKINNIVIKELVELSNYLEFGARKIDKLIRQKLESIIIENVMNGNDNVNIKTIKEKSIV